MNRYHVAFNQVTASSNHVTIDATSPLVYVHDHGVYSTCAVGGVISVYTGAVILTVSVVIVPLNPKALHVHTILAPKVIPASSITVPINVEVAPSVVAPTGVQKTSHADAPPVNVTCELAVVLSAPLALKI